MKKILLALMFVAWVANTGSAANRYWDPDLTAAGNSTVTGDGLGGAGGAWDTTTANWWDGTSAADAAWTDANTAIFWGPYIGAQSVTIATGQTRTVTGLTFKTDGYIIDGGVTTTLGTTAFGAVQAALVADPSVIGTIKTRMTGTGGFTVSGGGTIVLAPFANVNTTTGPVSVTGGSILEQSRGGDIGGSTGALTIDNGTYRVTDVTAGGNLLAATRGIIVGAGGATLNTPTAAQILLYGGTISGTGNTLTKTGPGEIRMSATPQTHTFGKLVIKEGRYTVGQATTLGQDTQLGAVPAAYVADAVILDGEGSGAILRFAGGTGTTTVTTSANRGITLGTTGGSTNTFQVGDTNAAIPAIITGSGGFTKTGALLLTLSGNNTYQGTTTVSAGTLRLANTAGSGVSNGAVTVASAAALEINTSTGSQANGGVTLSGAISGTGTLNGPLTLNAGARVIPGAAAGNAVFTVQNADFSTGVALQSTLGATGSSDVLKVAGANQLNFNGGTITLAPLAATNPSGQTYVLADYTTGFTGNLSSMLLNNLTGFDGTTVFNDAANHVIKATIGTTAIDRTWNRETDFGNWSNDVTADGANWSTGTPANGIGSIARFPATVTTGPSAGNPIQSQTVTISDLSKTVGTLVLDNPNQLTFATSNGSRLVTQTYTGNALIDVKQGSHRIDTGGTGAGGSMTMTSATDVNIASGAELTLSPVANAGGMNKNGLGILKIVKGDWSGTGATNVNQGTLQYSSDNLSGLGNSSTITVAAGATVDMNSSSAGKVNDTIGALAGAGSFINHGNLTIGGTNTTPVTFSGTLGLSTALGGNNDPFFNGSSATTAPASRVFTKNGSGTQIISGALESTAAGCTICGNFTSASVAAGTLILNNAANTSLTVGTLPLGLSTTTVASGATLGGNGYIAGPVTVSAGGILAPGSSGIGTLHLQNGVTALTLTNAASTNSILSIELNTVSGVRVNDSVDASTAAVNVVTGTSLTKINVLNAGAMTAGLYSKIIDYSTLTGAGFAGLAIGTVPAGFSAKLINNTVDTSIDLQLQFIADFNSDNAVNSADYVIWRKFNGLTSGALFSQGDANGDGAVNAADYNLWRSNFGNVVPGFGSGSSLGNGGAVPEPSTIGLLGLALLAFASGQRVRKS